MSNFPHNSEHIDQRVVVPPDLGGQRFDRIAADLFSRFSRVELSRWIEQGCLTVDGQTRKGKSRLRGGEVLHLQAVQLPREDWQQAEAMPLDLVYEDDHLLVLNKPAGLVVHPGAGNPAGTLLNGLLHHRPGLSRLPRAGVVHRLDKDTSGIMVVAASDQAQKALSRMISSKQVGRTYLGVAEGRMVAGQDVDKAIGRHPQVRTRQAVREDGKPAYTQFRVRERFRTHTLVQAKLGTGRTHQIRVHLQSIGYPLVGDRRYGARGRVPAGASAELLQALQQFPRQALHALQLTLQHPVTQQMLDFTAPLAADMQHLLAQLRKDTNRSDVHDQPA